MSTFHGSCVGPMGARLYHHLCPHTWTTFYGEQITCSCECHGEEAQNMRSDAQNAPSEPCAETREGNLCTGLYVSLRDVQSLTALD